MTNELPCRELSLFKVRTADFADREAIQELYETSFPAPERRDFNKLLQLLQEPDMCLQLLRTNDRLVGLAVHWQLDALLYLEHLAIMPGYRGSGYGKAFLKGLMNVSDNRLVLEVERPENDSANRRIRFYEQLGLTLQHQFDYLQPPYEPDGQPVPLYLMAKPAIATTEECQRIASTIRQRVYERF